MKLIDLKKNKNWFKIEKDIMILISKLYLFFPSLFSSDLFPFLLSSNSSTSIPHFFPTVSINFGYYKFNKKKGLLIIETLFSLFLFYFYFYIF
jgi:hypothetical protein